MLPGENDDSTGKSVRLWKLNDLNDFCLLKILGRLDLQSLLNAADTNKRLRSLATDVYNRGSGTKTVDIDIRKVIFERDDPVQESSNFIRIRGLKPSLQCLRCFGPYINGLSIGYYISQSKSIHEYINSFCAESLLRIRFDGTPAIEQFQKVFVNIQDVTLVECDLGDKWPLFVKLFANLGSLSLFNVSMVHHSIEKPFPNLERLDIRDLYCDGSSSFDIAADLLKGINQLKCLEIGYHENERASLSIVKLLDLVKDNPSISVLSVDAVYGRATSAEIQRIISEHPALVELGLESCSFTPDQAIALLPQLASLKKFEFHTQVDYCSNERDEFAEKLDNLGWDLSIGDTGCCLRTFIYDMYVTVTRRAQ